MSISSVGAVTAVRPPAPAPAPAQQSDAAPTGLAPAVRIDIRTADTPHSAATDRSESKATSEDSVERHNRIDPDTKTVVYQEVDPASGDIVVQIPDAVVLKARAYAEAQAARGQKAERPVDRTA